MGHLIVWFGTLALSFSLFSILLSFIFGPYLPVMIAAAVVAYVTAEVAEQLYEGRICW